MIAREWVRCPICSNKTRDRIREDTVLINYPLYCPKCKQETLINVWAYFSSFSLHLIQLFVERYRHEYRYDCGKHIGNRLGVHNSI